MHISLSTDSIQEIGKKNRNEKKGQSTRDLGVDFLKIIACIAVILLHTIPKEKSPFYLGLYYLSGFAVPVFFGVSGYLILNEKHKVDFRYCYTKILKILKVVILWNVMIWGIKNIVLLVQHKEVSFNILNLFLKIVKSILQKDSILWHFWYLGAFMLIIMSMITIKKIMSSSKACYFLVFIILLSQIIQTISTIKGYPIQEYVIQTFRIWTWIMYFMIGGGIARSKKLVDFITSNRKKLILITLLYSVMIVILHNYENYQVFNPDKGQILLAEYFYDSIFTVVWVVLLICTMINIKFENIMSRIIFRLSSVSMGVYILHPIWIAVLHKFGIEKLLNNGALYLILVLVLSFVSAFILRSNKYTSHLISL